MGMVPILWTSTPDGGKFDSFGAFMIPFLLWARLITRTCRLESCWWRGYWYTGVCSLPNYYAKRNKFPYWVWFSHR